MICDKMTQQVFLTCPTLIYPVCKAVVIVVEGRPGIMFWSLSNELLVEVVDGLSVLPPTELICSI